MKKKTPLRLLLIADQFKWIIHGLVEVKCSITDKDETLSCRSVFFFQSLLYSNMMKTFIVLLYFYVVVTMRSSVWYIVVDRDYKLKSMGKKWIHFMFEINKFFILWLAGIQ